MTDDELAQAVVALGVIPKAAAFYASGMIGAEGFVRDPGVAMAVADIAVGPSKTLRIYNFGGTYCAMVKGRDREFRDENMSRAIIAACVEALS